MPRYVIIGAGATGASLAAQLHEAGVSYVLVGRGRQASLLAEEGLLYRRPAGEVRVPLHVAVGDVELQPEDVLVFTPKTQDLDAALSSWAWRPVAGGGLAADLPAITLQNGLEAERLALRRFRHVLGASFHLPAAYVEPGVVEVRSNPTIAVVLLGRYPAGPDPLAETVAADWNASGYAVQVTDDIRRWKASKLLWNVNNAVDVLAGSDEEIAALKEGLAEEARRVLRAAGVDVADPQAENTIDRSGFVVAPRRPGGPAGMSTWQSFARPDARGHEVDYLNGELVLLAREHGVEAPLNEAVQRLLGGSFDRREPPGTHYVAELTGSGAPAPSRTPGALRGASREPAPAR